MDALTLFIKENVDVFVWKPIDMPGIDPNLFYHKLVVNPSIKLICQRRRKMALERLEEIERQVKELQETGFIREIRYMTWLANVVSLSKNIMKNGECALTTSI